MILEGLALSQLWGIYRDYKGRSTSAGQKRVRIENARNALLPQVSTYESIRKKTESVADDNSNWKGAARKEFDRYLDSFFMSEMTARKGKLDGYCNSLNDAALAASRESNSYLPVISDVWNAIQNFANISD